MQKKQNTILAGHFFSSYRHEIWHGAI